MTQVTLRVENAGTYAKVVQSKLAFSRIEGEVVMVRSQLGPQEPVNEHLVGCGASSSMNAGSFSPRSQLARESSVNARFQRERPACEQMALN
jgi:hypothetical protein